MRAWSLGKAYSFGEGTRQCMRKRSKFCALSLACKLRILQRVCRK